MNRSLVNTIGLVDLIVSLLVAVILIYIGTVIIWSLNPLFAVVFVVLAVLVVARAVRRGDSDGL